MMNGWSVLPPSVYHYVYMRPNSGSQDYHCSCPCNGHPYITKCTYDPILDLKTIIVHVHVMDIKKICKISKSDWIVEKCCACALCSQWIHYEWRTNHEICV